MYLIMTKSDPKAKVRNKPSPVFDAKHPKVRDDKDHFPLGNENQARNAIARVNQYSAVPEWYSGSLKSLQNSVIRAVKSKYPTIEISEEAKKPKKASFNEIFTQLMRLKIGYPNVYVGTIDGIKNKIASNEEHYGWNSQELQALINKLEN